jgi:uncharacterized protein YjgD (DUF1641 family)
VTGPATIDRTAELESKIDQLTEQVAFLVEEGTAQRRRRQTVAELQADLTPIAMRAIEQSAYALDEAHIDPHDLLQLAVRVAENAGTLESLLLELQSMKELLNDIKPIINRSVELAITKAGELEERGYFEFATAGIGVMDRIVTSFSAQDVEALGDNVVHMLGIVKDLTQPEMLAVADRLLDVVRRQAQAAELEPEKPPSLIALAGKMRDPEIRMGLARALNTFKAVSASETDVAHDIVDAARFEAETNNTQGGA